MCVVEYVYFVKRLGYSFFLFCGRPLKHWIQYTTLISSQTRTRLLNTAPEAMYRTIEQSPHTLLSEFPEFLSREKQLDVPVYTVWGACEDVAIIEKFRSQEFHIDNLFLLDEASTHVLDIGGVSLRLFGLGGAVVQHKLFDNGEGVCVVYTLLRFLQHSLTFFLLCRYGYNCWWIGCDVDNCFADW